MAARRKDLLPAVIVGVIAPMPMGGKEMYAGSPRHAQSYAKTAGASLGLLLEMTVDASAPRISKARIAQTTETLLLVIPPEKPLLECCLPRPLLLLLVRGSGLLDYS